MAKGDIQGDILYRDRATSTLNRVGDAAETSGRKFGTMKKAAIAGGALAGAALVKFGKDSVKAFSESEVAQSNLELAYRKFPKAANVSIDALRDYNAELAKKVTFDDDALASGQAVLAQFDLTGSQIMSVTPLLTDLATKTGKDLPEAATLLGKAANGNTKALKALGINYKATGDKTKDFNAVTALLEQKVGGAAAAMGETAAGKAQILGNQFGELQEAAGAKLVPALTKVAEVGLKVVDFISRNQAVIVPLVAVVGTIVAAIKVWTAVQTALNVVMALNPIGLVVVAVAALAAGLVVAYKKSETFRDIVHGAFTVVGTAIRFVKEHWKAFATTLAFLIGGPIVGGIVLLVTHFGKIKTAATSVWKWVTDKFTALVGFVTGLPGKITNATKGMFEGIKDAFRSAINWLIDKWNGLEFGIPAIDTHIPGVGKVGGFSLGTPDIPHLAQGGIVPATPGGRLILAGEGGRDEAIVPLPRGGAGGAGVVVNINGPVYGADADELADNLADKLERAFAKRQRGGRKLAFS